MKFSFKQNIIIIVIAAVLAIGAGVGAVVIGVSSMPASRVSRYMGAAERYLSELDYKQAIIEYQRILEIEPRNVDAYIGLAKAYEKIGDDDKAVRILQKGFEVTDDKRLKKRLDKLQNPEESSQSGESSASTSGVHAEPEPVEINYVTPDLSFFEVGYYGGYYDGDTIFGYKGTFENMKIPEGIEYIEPVGADSIYYRWCSEESSNSLKNLMLPDSLTEISLFVISSFPNLESISISDNNPYYSTVDGVLFNKSKTQLIYCPDAKRGSYTIPDSVTSVSSSAFSNCRNLTNITLNNNLTKIEYYAFAGCSNLKEITIPDSITEIGSAAFSECSNLKEITIPSSVSVIGEQAFSECDNLSQINISADNKIFCSVDGILFSKDKTKLIAYPAGKSNKYYSVPDGVVDIKGAFAGCKNLVSVSIPESISTIGWSAFYNCEKLFEVILPSGLKDIEPYAFDECPNLKMIVLPEGVKLHAYDMIDVEIRPFNGRKDIALIYKGRTYYGFEELPKEIIVGNDDF